MFNKILLLLFSLVRGAYAAAGIGFVIWLVVKLFYSPAGLQELLGIIGILYPFAVGDSCFRLAKFFRD